jgi:IS30 family transposase
MIKYKRINCDERKAISILRSKGYRSNRIAEFLGRSVSSITREVKRNSYLGVFRCLSGPLQGRGKATKYSHKEEGD